MFCSHLILVHTYLVLDCWNVLGAIEGNQAINTLQAIENCGSQIFALKNCWENLNLALTLECKNTNTNDLQEIVDCFVEDI